MKKLPKFNFSALKKILPKARRARIMTLGSTLVVIALLISALIYLLMPGDPIKERDKQITQKIKSVDNPNASCKDVVAAIGGINPSDTNKQETQMELLEKQMLCFADQFQYDRAIDAGEKLKTLYASKSDNQNVERVEARISDFKETKSHAEERARNSGAQ